MVSMRALLSAAVMLVVLQRPASAASDAEGCGACAGCGGIMILIPIAFIALGIMYMAWVAKDAKARRMENAILWMILAISWVGLIVYLLVRPKGKLILCPHCNEKRLETSATCPHCGRA